MGPVVGPKRPTDQLSEPQRFAVQNQKPGRQKVTALPTENGKLIFYSPLNFQEYFNECNLSNYWDLLLEGEDTLIENVEERGWIMVKSISWLHLTDLHQGMKEQDWLWPTLRDEFYRDLRKMHDKSGPWDLVLFTGDLTQKGSKREFEKLDKTLKDLWQHLQQLGSLPILLVVPGNHDLVRPQKESAIVQSIQNWENNQPIRQAFWENERSDYRKAVKKAFAPFMRWWLKWQADQSIRPLKWQPGLLPGDFSATVISENGLRLGVAGLNSAFLQLSDANYERKLDIHVSQLQTACDGDASKWSKSHDLSLLLTHHPQTWLSHTAEKHFQFEILARDRFIAHLFGHMHENATRNTRIAGGVPRLEYQAASLFGLEYYKSNSNQDQERSHGYIAGKIELDGELGVFKIWPRLLVQKGNRHWEMDRDSSFSLDSDEAYSESFTYQADPPPISPLDLASAQLQKSQSVLNTIDPNFNVLGTTQNKFYIYPQKSYNPEDSPTGLNINLKVDDTPESNNFKEGIKNAIKTGGTFTIRQENIEKIVPTGILKQIGDQLENTTVLHFFPNPGGLEDESIFHRELKSLGYSLEDAGQIIIFADPNKPVRPFPDDLTIRGNVEFKTSDSEIFPLGMTELRLTQRGTEEQTFSNIHQQHPIIFKMIQTQHDFQLSITQKFEGFNVKRLLEAFRFLWAVTSRQGILRFCHPETGFPSLEFETNGNQTTPHLNKDFERTLEKLVFIQNKTQIPIALPFEGITHKDSELIDAIEQILRTGTIPLSPGSLTMNLNRSILENLIKKLSGTDNGIVLVSQEEERWKIFDVEIPMGKRVTYCREVTIPKENLEAINSALLTLREDETIPVQFQSLNNEPIYLQFPFWIEKNRQTNLL